MTSVCVLVGEKCGVFSVFHQPCFSVLKMEIFPGWHWIFPMAPFFHLFSFLLKHAFLLRRGNALCTHPRKCLVLYFLCFQTHSLPQLSYGTLHMLKSHKARDARMFEKEAAVIVSPTNSLSLLPCFVPWPLSVLSLCRSKFSLDSLWRCCPWWSANFPAQLYLYSCQLQSTKQMFMASPAVSP